MARIILIGGGARSGKSSLAEQKALELGKRTAYIATSIPFDDGMKDRVLKHRQSRPGSWATIEQYRDFETLLEQQSFLSAEVIVLDCLTLMVSNIMLESGLDFDRCDCSQIDSLENEITSEIAKLLEVLKRQDKISIMVTNEVGLGIIPDNRLGSIFRDIAGRVNQKVAGQADEVYMVFMGIENRIK